MAVKGRNARAFLACFLGAGISFLLVSSERAPAQTFTSGEWKGERLLDQAGNFAGCGINKMYAGGTRLGFAIGPKGNLEFWLMNLDWTYSAGEQFDVHFTIDDGDRQHGPAMAQVPEAIAILVSPAKTTFERLKHARVLSISFARKNLRFDLPGASAALDKLLDCFYAAREAEARSSGDTGKGAVAGIAASFARGAIGKMSGDDVRILEGRSEPLVQLMQAALVWKTKHGFGFADSVPNLPLDVEVWIKTGDSTDRTSCLGDFASSTSIRKFGTRQNITVSVLMTGCSKHKDWNSPVHMVYNYFPLEAGDMIRITHFATNPADAIAADKRFFEAAKKMVEALADRHRK